MLGIMFRNRGPKQKLGDHVKSAKWVSMPREKREVHFSLEVSFGGGHINLGKVFNIANALEQR